MGFPQMGDLPKGNLYLENDDTSWVCGGLHILRQTQIEPLNI